LNPPPDPATGSRPVTVVTDSTSYVPAEMLDALGVERVSLYVGWDGELRREDEYDPASFYARLRDSADLPTTSQPSVGDFTDAYEPILRSGRDVVSVHIAASLSGTCESARGAAERLAGVGRVEVVDAETGAGGLGCLVIAAAEAARSGAEADEVVAAIAAARSELDIWFCLDTLEYLRRGGRIGAAQALVGSALRIKPILTFGTEISPVGRVRTHARGIKRMEEYLDALRSRGATDWIVQHAQCATDADALVGYGRSAFGSEPLFCTEVGPVLGAHLGSGVLVGGMTRPEAATRA
jgi:DegV family protein with EDD domain